MRITWNDLPTTAGPDEWFTGEVCNVPAAAPVDPPALTCGAAA